MIRTAASIAFVMILASPALLRAQGRTPGSPLPGQAAPAAPANAGAPVEAERTLIRTYDLTNLFRVPRNYPLPTSMVPATRLPGGQMQVDPNGQFGGGMPGAMGSEGEMMGGATQPPTVDSITSLIMNTVAPESWREAGGAIGSARLLGTRLVVSQTAANQKQIEDLLNGIRDEGGGAYMVSINAYWVQFTPDDLRAIAGKPGDVAAGAALKEVPEALLTDAKLYSRGQTLGFSGQTVHVASGRANTVITGMDPVVGTQAVGYHLQTATVQSGVALQVTPQVLGEGETVSLDLHSIVSELGDAASLPDPRVLGRDGPTTQPIEQQLGKRPRVVAQQFSTTARVPVGKKVLIGGMTFDPGANAAGAKQLYLVVEANAIK
ncbi:MAG: type II and III secretion system protein [Planctomycetota bacterium]|nr:type II and III secretion system protein [Planctomycetota bacterium]